MAARAVLSPAPLRGALVVRAHAGCGKDHAHSAARASKPRTVAPTRGAAAAAGRGVVAAAAESPERVEAFLDGLKYDDKGLVVAIAQDVDTGAILMQGFADRTAVRTTITAKKATFFSRSRQAQWTKGETSGNFISVKSVHIDCDKDSLIYMGVPDGPTCHSSFHLCLRSGSALNQVSFSGSSLSSLSWSFSPTAAASSESNPPLFNRTLGTELMVI